MGNHFSYGATFRRPRFADRQTDLFGGTDFIAPDVLFKTTNAGEPKNTEDIQWGTPAEG